MAIESHTPTICLGFAGPGTPIDKKHRLDADVGLCDNPGQRGATAIGPVFAATYVCRSCCCNAERACRLRHLCPFPTHVAPLELPEHFVRAVAHEYRVQMPGTRDEWFSKWTPAKQKAILRSEHEDALVRGRVNATIKRESGHKFPTKPRLIQAYPNLRSQCEFAPEHSVFQKALFAVTAGCPARAGYEIFPGIYVAGTSGWTARQLSAWADTHRGRLLYERDGERWDSTMQRAHHELKWRVMHACDPKLARSVRADYCVKGVFRGRGGAVKYVSNGAVKSGHNDTTSGNTLINLVIAANALRDVGVRGSIIAIGDDLLAAVEHDVPLEDIAARESAYGIIPTFERRRGFHDATYASGTWLDDGERHLYVPLLGRLMARQWWAIDPCGPRGYARRRHGIACGMLALVSGIPLYDEFYRPHVDARWRIEYGHSYRPGGPADVDNFDAYGAFALRYNCTEHEIRELQQYFTELTKCPSLVVRAPELAWRIIQLDAPGAVVQRDALFSLVEQGAIMRPCRSA